MSFDEKIARLPVPQQPVPMDFFYKRVDGVTTIKYYGVRVVKREMLSQQQVANIFVALAPLALFPERSN